MDVMDVPLAHSARHVSLRSEKAYPGLSHQLLETSRSAFCGCPFDAVLRSTHRSSHPCMFRSALLQVDLQCGIT
jgi:hypothetical protein